MHELSLSYAMVDTVLESLVGMNVRRIVSVTVSAGELSGVSADALRFSFPIAAAGTLVEGVELKVESAPVTVYCGACDAIAPLASLQQFCCPTCGRPSADVRGGQHLVLQSIELEAEER
ncbi:MAG: hydrogenase maturation nickel metallochaperone HypA [Bryobacteraceae bacterium]|nr:hydrogenase maturation nickel metallochaperone HypA [Bryobacteraceae bacterium]